MSRLAGGYRLLLRSYPRGPRREELLDTLMAAAPAGRRRPTAGEAANLLRHGLRARLGRPGSRGVVLLATLVALVAGFLGAAAAARAAWELAPGFPGGAALAEITGTIDPAGRPVVERHGAGLFDDPVRPSTAQVLLRGHDEDFGFATLSMTPAGGFVAGDYRAWTAAAQGRLVRAGWQVSDSETTGATDETGAVEDTGRTITATRGGYALRIDTSTEVVGTPAGSFDVTATLDRLTPWYVHAITILGLLAGALIGWVVTGWASRRTEGARATRVAGTPAVVALVLLVPQAMIGFLVLGYETAAGGPPGAPFWTYSVTYFFGLARLGLLGLGISLLAAALARPAEQPAVAAPPERLGGS